MHTGAARICTRWPVSARSAQGDCWMLTCLFFELLAALPMPPLPPLPHVRGTTGR